MTTNAPPKGIVVTIASRSLARFVSIVLGLLIPLLEAAKSSLEENLLRDDGEEGSSNEEMDIAVPVLENEKIGERNEEENIHVPYVRMEDGNEPKQTIKASQVEMDESAPSQDASLIADCDKIQTSTNVIDWNEVGKSIQDGVKQVDWKEVGREMEQAVKEVDWKEVRQSIKSGFESVDWNEVGQSIKEAFEESGKQSKDASNV